MSLFQKSGNLENLENLENFRKIRKNRKNRKKSKKSKKVEKNGFFELFDGKKWPKPGRFTVNIFRENPLFFSTGCRPPTRTFVHGGGF